jgi:hypothetical protein
MMRTYLTRLGQISALLTAVISMSALANVDVPEIEAPQAKPIHLDCKDWVPEGDWNLVEDVICSMDDLKERGGEYVAALRFEQGARLHLGDKRVICEDCIQHEDFESAVGVQLSSETKLEGEIAGPRGGLKKDWPRRHFSLQGWRTAVLATVEPTPEGNLREALDANLWSSDENLVQDVVVGALTLDLRRSRQAIDISGIKLGDRPGNVVDTVDIYLTDAGSTEKAELLEANVVGIIIDRFPPKEVLPELPAVISKVNFFSEGQQGIAVKTEATPDLKALGSQGLQPFLSPVVFERIASTGAYIGADLTTSDTQFQGLTVNGDTGVRADIQGVFLPTAAPLIVDGTTSLGNVNGIDAIGSDIEVISSVALDNTIDNTAPRHESARGYDIIDRNKDGCQSIHWDVYYRTANESCINK